MRIAIDGRSLGDRAGKAIYTRSVLLSWQAETSHRFTVYGYQPPAGEHWPPNWQFVKLPSAWQRVMAFRRLAEDVLFSPTSYLTTIVSNRPTLTTVHDLVLYKAAAKLPFKTVLAERFLLGWAVRRSAAITVQTECVKADLIKHFPAATPKTTVVLPGVAAASGRSALPSEHEQRALLKKLGVIGKYILAVGTLEPRKNAGRLIEAYQSLGEAERATYQLVLAGKLGWADRSLKQVLSHLPPGVVVTGRLPDAAIATLYRHATAVAFPSLYEGVGYPVLEGFYWQKPVLTSRGSSLEEVAGSAALLVDPYSTTEIVSGLQELLTNDNERQGLVEAGSRRLTDFSWARTAQTYLAILQGITYD